MDERLKEEIAGMYAASTMAYGVLVKAIRDHLPPDDAAFFIESVTGQLRGLETNPKERPTTARYLSSYRAVAADIPEN